MRNVLRFLAPSLVAAAVGLAWSAHHSRAGSTRREWPATPAEAVEVERLSAAQRALNERRDALLLAVSNRLHGVRVGYDQQRLVWLELEAETAPASSASAVAPERT